MERKEVYKVIDTEQAYVDKCKENNSSHIVEDFKLAHALGAIQYNLVLANDSWYNGHEPYQDSMEYIRKIANICVQMGEKYGLPSREGVTIENTSDNDRIKELEEAIQWFVDRCDKGEVRSRQTYARYKELLGKKV